MGSGMTVELKIDPPDGTAGMQNVLAQVEDRGPMVHLKWVFRVMEYVVKYSRVRTGRSRAAWFPLMDYYGYNYQRSLGGQRVEPSAVADGYAQGYFESIPFLTTIMNNVDYVDPMNRRFGLFGFAAMTSGKMKLASSDGIRFEEKIPVFEQYGVDIWNDFLELTRQAFEKGGDIPDQDVPPPMQM